MDETTFHYSITCSSPGCTQVARYRIAARWSDGPLREWKNYGLACESHRDALLAQAASHRESLAVRDDEQVGPVEVFELLRASEPACK